MISFTVCTNVKKRHCLVKCLEQNNTGNFPRTKNLSTRAISIDFELYHEVRYFLLTGLFNVASVLSGILQKKTIEIEITSMA